MTTLATEWGYDRFGNAFIGGAATKPVKLSDIGFAAKVDLSDGRRIWIPPSGRPYWVGGPNAGPDLSDDEMGRYLA